MRRVLMLVPIVLTSYAQFTPRHTAPIACQLITLDDVHAALGASWVASPASFNTNTDKMTTCYYQNGVGNLVAFSLVYAPKGDAKAEVAKRQKNVSVTHTVTAIPDLCEGAFAEVITAQNTTLIAAKGEWVVQVQVMVAKKPDVEAEKTLAAGVCKRL